MWLLCDPDFVMTYEESRRMPQYFTLPNAQGCHPNPPILLWVTTDCPVGLPPGSSAPTPSSGLLNTVFVKCRLGLPLHKTLATQDTRLSITIRPHFPGLPHSWCRSAVIELVPCHWAFILLHFYIGAVLEKLSLFISLCPPFKLNSEDMNSWKWDYQVRGYEYLYVYHMFAFQKGGYRAL